MPPSPGGYSQPQRENSFERRPVPDRIQEYEDAAKRAGESAWQLISHGETAR